MQLFPSFILLSLFLFYWKKKTTYIRHTLFTFINKKIIFKRFKQLIYFKRYSFNFCLHTLTRAFFIFLAWKSQIGCLRVTSNTSEHCSSSRSPCWLLNTIAFRNREQKNKRKIIAKIWPISICHKKQTHHKSTKAKNFFVRCNFTWLNDFAVWKFLQIFQLYFLKVKFLSNYLVLDLV